MCSEAQSLAAHPGWKRMLHEIDRRIKQDIDSLLIGSEHDDVRRGQIKAFKTTCSMPSKIIESAMAELSRHRGN